MDADSATPFSCLNYLHREMIDSVADVVVGTRVACQRSFIRFLFSRAFFIIRKKLLGCMIHDTQCGFKLFTRHAARQIFPSIHLNRWGFDVEIFKLCDKLQLKTRTMGVEWEEKDGSKVNLIADSVNLLKDLLLIKFIYDWKR